MIYTTELLPGITLRCCRDTRFKQGCMTFQIIRPMNRAESAMNALIPSVLIRGTRSHDSLRSITQRLDELYGAAVSPIVRRVGDYHTTGLYCGFMDERFAMAGDEILRPMAEFLMELLLDSPVEDGGFRKDFVESEKKNLIATIESELNDKRVYSVFRLLEHMCREDSSGIPRLGKKEDIALIDPVKMYAYYRSILRESPIHIFYVGSAQPEAVAQILRPVLSVLDRSPVSLPAQSDLRIAPGEDLVEAMEVSQGKLCMGFTTPITVRSPEFAAMQMANIIFGGGMTSKLFMNIRERMSLCYSIGSSYYGTKGMVLVSAGIDFDKETLTRAEVLRQLDACRNGQITQEELNAARAAYRSSLRSSKDSPGAIESYYSGNALNGSGLTLEKHMEMIEQVTLEQVVAAANTLELNTTYFLKGVSQ